MLKKITYLLLATLSVFLIQGCSLKTRINKADKQFKMGEYYAAGESYKRVFREFRQKTKLYVPMWLLIRPNVTVY